MTKKSCSDADAEFIDIRNDTGLLSETELKRQIRDLCRIRVTLANREIEINPLSILMRKYDPNEVLDKLIEEYLIICNVRDEYLSVLKIAEIDFKNWVAHETEKIKAKQVEVKSTEIKNLIEEDIVWVKKKVELVDAEKNYNKMNNIAEAIEKKIMALHSRAASERRERYSYNMAKKIGDQEDE